MRAGSSRSSIVNNRVLRFGQEVASGNGVEVSGYAFTYGTHNPHDVLAEALGSTFSQHSRHSCRGLEPNILPRSMFFFRKIATMFLPRLGHAPLLKESQHG